MKQEVKDAIKILKEMETTVNYVLEDMRTHERIAWMLNRLFACTLQFKLTSLTTIQGLVNENVFCTITDRKLSFVKNEFSVEQVRQRLHIIAQLTDKGEGATAEELERELSRDFLEFVAEKGNDDCSAVAKELMK